MQKKALEKFFYEKLAEIFESVGCTDFEDLQNEDIETLAKEWGKINKKREVVASLFLSAKAEKLKKLKRYKLIIL